MEGEMMTYPYDVINVPPELNFGHRPRNPKPIKFYKTSACPLGILIKPPESENKKQLRVKAGSIFVFIKIFLF